MKEREVEVASTSSIMDVNLSILQQLILSNKMFRAGHKEGVWLRRYKGRGFGSTAFTSANTQHCSEELHISVVIFFMG